MKILMTTLLLTLSSLSFAQYVTVDAQGKVVEMTASAIGSSYGGTFDESAFEQFDSYAKATGGQMGFCPEFEHLPKIMDSLLNNILKTQTNNKTSFYLLIRLAA